jgi:hypothetical protein
VLGNNSDESTAAEDDSFEILNFSEELHESTAAEETTDDSFETLNFSEERASFSKACSDVKVGTEFLKKFYSQLGKLEYAEELQKMFENKLSL